MKTTVLIIGAGPTGLMMACQLAALNVPFVIVEKDPSTTYESRAIGIQARSLEIFQQMGIADTFLKEGNPAGIIDFIANGKIREHVPLSGLGTGLTQFPFLLFLEQFRTEAILVDFLKKHKISVLWDTTVLSFTQTQDGTTSVIQHKDGKEETIEADWIVGADGAHSIVRHTLGIELAGKTYKQSLFVLDCKVASPVLSSTHLAVLFSDTAFAAIFPMKDNHWRIVGEVPPRLYGKDTITFEDVAKDFAKRMQLDITLSHPYWVSLYHAHHRCVNTFKKGRCFLGGDAGHIHSPVGAQGMNTGLQDAYNLAWKIAFVHKDLAKEALLETFNEDRMPFAKKLVETTDRAFNFVVAGGKIGAFFRTHIAPKVIKFVISKKISREFVFRTVSQIGISYHSSSLSKNASFGNFPKSAPLPGDRLPFITFEQDKNIQDEIKITHMQLLLFTGKSEEMNDIEQVIEKYSKAIAVTKIPFNEHTKDLYEKFGIENNGYYLVRPDMYIACRSNGENKENFEEYLSKFLI
ncbi:MAG TPA: FAD-dependent monooxygenase [Candidatus Eisenbacteria bacterium]|nr:FAD-dependent monooxygenase [Candidatus Eisenbacteria bacterium]